MKERGEYRSISIALLDSAEYQQLPAEARSVLLHLKLGVRPAGIEIAYPAGLREELSARTGYDGAALEPALQALEEGAWLRRADNLIWVVGQLASDPHVVPSNAKHRSMIQRHTSTLPKHTIVRAFIATYRQWFTADGGVESSPLSPFSWAFEAAPPAGRRVAKRPKTSRSTSARIAHPAHENRASDSLSDRVSDSLSDRVCDTEREVEGEVEVEILTSPNGEVPRAAPEAAPSNPRAPTSWSGRLGLFWSDRVGAVNYGMLGKLFKAGVEKHGEAAVERAMGAYIEDRKEQEKPCKLAWLAEELEVWIERSGDQGPLVDEGGAPTPAALRALGIRSR